MINSINTYAPQQKASLYRKNNRAIQANINFGGAKPNDFFSRMANKKQTQKIIFAIANNSVVKGLVNWASKEKTTTNKNGTKITTCNSDKLTQYLMVGYSALLQINHIINIYRNKQMPEERKETLIVNNALAFVLPTIGAFTVDSSINRGINSFKNYAERVKQRKLNTNQLHGLKALKSVFIFGMMYKYFATVITTPLADVATDWLRERGLIGKKRLVAEAKSDKSEAFDGATFTNAKIAK